MSGPTNVLLMDRPESRTVEIFLGWPGDRSEPLIDGRTGQPVALGQRGLALDYELQRIASSLANL